MRAAPALDWRFRRSLSISVATNCIGATGFETSHERPDRRLSYQAFVAHVGFYGREHGGADALFAGRSFLGWTSRQGSHRCGRCRWKSHYDRAGVDPNARRRHNRANLASRRKKRSAARGTRLQSIMRDVDLDCARARRSRLCFNGRLRQFAERRSRPCARPEFFRRQSSSRWSA